jgi:formate hydrogenlyase subunit 3/multisubunit Na+/H+ antiporter MnhD subunit
MESGGLKLRVGFLIDQLTVLMMLVVTFVSLMVHIYTIGYMAHDEDPGAARPAPQLPALLQLHLAVHLLDADAGDERTTSSSCSSAGRRWAWCPTC